MLFYSFTEYPVPQLILHSPYNQSTYGSRAGYKIATKIGLILIRKPEDPKLCIKSLNRGENTFAYFLLIWVHIRDQTASFGIMTYHSGDPPKILSREIRSSQILTKHLIQYC